LFQPLPRLAPDLVPSVPLYFLIPLRWWATINRAAFTNPPLVRDNYLRQAGDTGRNALLGFGMWQLDMALRRQFSLTERFKLQFRASSSTVQSSNFGDPGRRHNSRMR